MYGPSEVWLRGGLRSGLRGSCGDLPGVGELMDPDPRTRDMPGGLKLVPTVWAQRAANAWYAGMRLGNRIVVDGVAGGQTLNALKDIRLRILATVPAPLPTDPAIVAMPQIADTGHVAISTRLFDMLRANVRVADPAGSTVGLCDWSAVPRTVMNVVSPSGDSAVAMAPSDIPVEGDLTAYSTDTVSTYVVPAVAFLASMALGVVLVRYGAPKRGRR